MATFKNPILPGFYPDPSICRVGEDYYMVNSTFAYFPGVPISHSKDLVHWETIGHVLTRASQLPLEGLGQSEGIFAPTIRYHKGIFYVITTNVGGIGNFYVTATQPEGPWSEPIILDAEGIDPSLFFEEDGKAYYIGMREKKPRRYAGDNEIWLQELDVEQGKLVGEKYVLWDGALKEAVWGEGPHLYKKDGYYYLMISEGGTGLSHSLVIARSKALKTGYKGFEKNPILTHRHLGKNHPIINTGHGDLVQTQKGDWWLVLLGSRPCEGCYNLGRETFLAPVVWEEDWPVVSPGKGRVEETMEAPALEEEWFMPKNHCEHFEATTLGKDWVFLRNPKVENYSLTARRGYLRLNLTPETLAQKVSPSFVAVRQRHMSFWMSACLEFEAMQEGEGAGLAMMQAEDFNLRFQKVRLQGKSQLVVIKREKGEETLLAQVPFDEKRFVLKVVQRGQKLYFFYGQSELKQLLGEVDSRFLSTNYAEGFVGTCVGLYASSHGKPTSNFVDVDWFEYSGMAH